jgi:hypothetical protein
VPLERPAAVPGVTLWFSPRTIRYEEVNPLAGIMDSIRRLFGGGSGPKREQSAGQVHEHEHSHAHEGGVTHSHEHEHEPGHEHDHTHDHD